MNRILFFFYCACICVLTSSLVCAQEELVSAVDYAQEEAAPAEYTQNASGAVTLKDSAVLAVKSNPKIKAMIHNRDAMEGNKAAALGRFFPSLDLRSAIGIRKDSTAASRLSGDDDFDGYVDTTLSLRLNLFAGFGDVSAYDSAKVRLSSAEYRLHDNVESIALDAIRAHYDVVRERRLLALAQKNIEDHKMLLGAIVERVQGGASDRADETQANSRLARAETTLISYQGKLRQAESDYIWATGVAPGVLETPVYHEEFLLGDLTAILEDSEANNPKILAAKEDAKALGYEVCVAQAKYYPRLDAVASTRYSDSLDDSGDYSYDHRGALEMTWNLFNGLSDVNNVKVAESRKKESYAFFDKAALDINRAVVAAWFDYQTAIKEVENYKRTLAFSKETNSLNEVFQNSVLLETALMNRSYSLYKLLALEGRLVKALEITYK